MTDAPENPDLNPSFDRMAEDVAVRLDAADNLPVLDLVPEGVDEDDLRPLTELEAAWCIRYATLESETFGDAKASAAAVGYSGPRTAGWRLKQRPAVRARLAELWKLNGPTAAKILADLEHTRIRALGKGDLATAARCSELAGKALGLFASVLLIDTPEQRELSERERTEALRLSRLMIEDELSNPSGKVLPTMTGASAPRPASDTAPADTPDSDCADAPPGAKDAGGSGCETRPGAGAGEKG